MIMTPFLLLNQHTIMKFTPLNHSKEHSTLITIMVSLKLMTKIGTGSIIMIQLVKFVIFNLLRMMMEN